MTTQEAALAVELAPEVDVKDQDATDVVLKLLSSSLRNQEKIISDGFAGLRAELKASMEAQARQQRFLSWLVAILVLGFMLKAGVDISQLAGLFQPF